MSNTDRKIIRVEIEYELDLDNKNLDDAIIHLQALRAKYPTGKITYDYAGGGYFLELHETRLENDEEYLNRLNQETISKEKERLKDLKLFNHLKEKLGL